MELNKWTDKEIAKTKLSFMNIARHIMPHFQVDERNKEIINDLFFYFHKIEGGKLDPEKGIWLEGDLGTGKSTLMLIFSEHLRRYWNGSGFKIYNCSTIANEYSSRDDDVLDRYTYNRNGYTPGAKVAMCFDELGKEPIPASRYGQKLNVMEHILHIRYTFWQTEKLPTYVTTNLDAQTVEDLYKDYIRDRRSEMFNIIAMTGKSRRK